MDHVFAARLVGGAWQPPERIDPGLPGPSSQPVLGVADGGRVVAAFVSGGALYGTSRVPGATGWSAPVQIAAAGTDPALDLSINGVAYVTFTSAGDVLAERLARDATAWEPMAQPLDITPADSSGDSDVAVSADGVALSTFVEGDKVVARKLFGTKVSQVPQVLNADQVEGQAGGAADSPDTDAEDDSSFAWVVFRQSFADHSRVLARRLLGSTFDPPVVVDSGASGSAPRIDLSERGEGTTAVAHARQRRDRGHAAPGRIRARRAPGQRRRRSSLPRRRRRSPRTARPRSAGCRRRRPRTPRSSTGATGSSTRRAAATRRPSPTRCCRIPPSARSTRPPGSTQPPTASAIRSRSSSRAPATSAGSSRPSTTARPASSSCTSVRATAR